MYTMKSGANSQQGHTYMQWLVAILANMILLSHGLQCGWISSSSTLLQSERSPTGVPLSNDEISLLASVPSLSAVISVIMFAYLVDKCGRKHCIIAMGVMQAICWIIKLCPATTISLIVARIFSGLGAGGGFNIVPMYVKEISQDDLRGTLGLLLAICQNVGIFAMYVMGGYLEYYTVLYIVVGVPLLTAFVMAITGPESPTYLMKIRKEDEAASVIASLRGLTVDDKRVRNEIDSIKSEDEQFKSIPNVSFVGILQHRAWRNGFCYMIVVLMLQGMSGGFTIVSYASSILQRSGVAMSPELLGFSIPGCMILASLLSMACIERVGRRLLLASAFLLSVLAFSGLATITVLQDRDVTSPDWLVVCCIALAMAAYAGGVSPMPFVIMSEMFNFHIRAKLMGVLVTLNWFFLFVQLSAFGPITEAFGLHVSFFCFATINSLAACMTLFCLPETKGKSVEEIEMELDQTRPKNNG